MRDAAGGVNQSGVRDHNARLILSLIQRHGPRPGSEIARRIGLSSQTVSVILRSLEEDGMIERGPVIRGQVGKPRVPMALCPDGVLSVGLKVGRRSADIVLMDLVGEVRQRIRRSYAYPVPDEIFEFLRNSLDVFRNGMADSLADRITGIGIAAPFELWNWQEAVGAPPGGMDVWRDLDFAARVAEFSPLPVLVENDATAAARAEHVFGRGPSLGDFAYFFIGAFVGGGVVVNGSIHVGQNNNAGAFGSLPMDAAGSQLIDHASLWLLEARLLRAGLDPARLMATGSDWSGFDEILSGWIDEAAAKLARAAITVASVIDFANVVIDGGFPPAIRTRLVRAVQDSLLHEDCRGIARPDIVEGTIGIHAQAIGAAALPIFSHYLLDTQSVQL